MKLDFSQTRIFLRPGFIDMRKAINGLSLMTEMEMGMDPFSGSLFLFCGKSRRILKAIYWDRNGFCLWVLCEASHNAGYGKPDVMKSAA